REIISARGAREARTQLGQLVRARRRDTQGSEIIGAGRRREALAQLDEFIRARRRREALRQLRQLDCARRRGEALRQLGQLVRARDAFEPFAQRAEIGAERRTQLSELVGGGGVGEPLAQRLGAALDLLDALERGGDLGAGLGALTVALALESLDERGELGAD